jgi:hypothetical protein
MAKTDAEEARKLIRPLYINAAHRPGKETAI